MVAGVPEAGAEVEGEEEAGEVEVEEGLETEEAAVEGVDREGEEVVEEADEDEEECKL